MADSLRVRGQEMQIRVTRNGVLETTLTAIKELLVTFKFDILREGYLGEVTDRRDDIYRGVAIEMTFHPESRDSLTMVKLVTERAQRRTAQSVARINLMTVLDFPNGQRPRLTFPDLKFGDIPLRMGARDQYIDMKWTTETEDYVLAGV